MLLIRRIYKYDLLHFLGVEDFVSNFCCKHYLYFIYKQWVLSIISIKFSVWDKCKLTCSSKK